MTKFKLTLLIETDIEAEDLDQAEELFWSEYHNDKDSMKWELVIKEQD